MSRRDNGLSAADYLPLIDVDPQLADHVLDALRRARIAAYLEPPAPPDERERLFVARDERGDARSVVASATRSFVLAPGADAAQTEATFARLISDWHVDTVAAVRAAERDLTREDAEWRARLLPAPGPADEDEHYVPPPPPPLPRLAPATVYALLVLAAALGVLAFGGLLGLGGNMRFLLGVAGLLTGAGMLVMRLRDRPSEGEDDDGAVL
jgi:hypothetical protein